MEGAYPPSLEYIKEHYGLFYNAHQREDNGKQNQSYDNGQDNYQSGFQNRYYPPSLEYIKEHYGLFYNEELFYIDYQPIGSNIMPDVTILDRTQGDK